MRNPGCNLALSLYDPKFGEDKLRMGMEDFVKYHRFAIAGLRRPRPPARWTTERGYFSLYGHQYAGMVLNRMPEADQARFWPNVVKGVLKTRQLDGSYWDYPTYGYHKFYGTGYALMTFTMCPEKIGATINVKNVKK